MPFGNLPTSGGGLRCWQLKNGLEAHGVEVVSSMPGFTYLAEKHFADIPEEQKELLWRWETQEEILRRVNPDAVMFASNWDHFGLTKPLDIPLIIDLHGSRLIETTMWNEPVSTERKISIIGKADCLLTAGTRQRLYFYGWLMQAGRVPKDEHFIRYIPISLSPEQPEHEFPMDDLVDDLWPRFVSGGGWFPWQNQAKSIFAICQEISKRDTGSIEIFGTPHESQQLSPAEREIRAVYAKVKDLSESSERINVNGYIGRDDLIKIYQRSGLAVEAMSYNLERELAFTTRTIEYLWCGLPVLYNNFSEISEHIKEYDAGWAIDPDSDAEIATAIEEIFSQPEILKQKSLNASRLVRDRFSWDKTITPLLDFLNNPTKAEAVEPALGAVYARPSFLVPRGLNAYVPLNAGKSVSQVFVLPADDIKSIEIPVYLNHSEDGVALEQQITTTLLNEKGAVIARRTLHGANLPINSNIVMKLPSWRRIKGGDELSVSISVDGKSLDEAAVFLTGMQEAKYPFRSLDVSLKGYLSLEDEDKVEIKTLALSFIPGTTPFAMFIVLGRRALRMIQKGDWRRFFNALRHRVPALIGRVR